MKSVFSYNGARYSLRQYSQPLAFDVADRATGESATLTGDHAAIFAERLYGLAARFPGMSLEALTHRAIEGAPMRAS